MPRPWSRKEKGENQLRDKLPFGLYERQWFRVVFSVTDCGMGVFRYLIKLGLEKTETFSARIQLKHCHL